MLVDGCLRVRTTGGPSLLIIWPPEVTLRTAGDAVQVVDATGQVVARVGALVLGGGETSSLESLSLREAPPSRCLGPYWLTGDIVVSPTPPRTAVRPPGVAFPQVALLMGGRALRLAQLEGRLTVVDGCLRVIESNGTTDYLVVWPADVTLTTDGSKMQVVFTRGGGAARIGEPVRLLGEAAPTLEQFGDESDKPLRETPPAHCPGPYWIGSHVLPPTPTATPPDWPTPLAPP